MSMVNPQYADNHSFVFYARSGRTRTAQMVTLFIDAETGTVLSDIAEYSGAAVKTYYRLN